MSGRATSSYTQSGFSLVELLVAMAIGLVTLAAILSIYLGTTVAGRQSDTVSRMSEDASIALETLSRHIRMAGYSRPVLMVGRNTATVNGQASQIADSHFAGAGIKGCDGGFNRTTDTWDALSCTNSSTQPDDIAVRYEGDSFNTEATANASASDCLGQGVADNANSAVTSSTQFTLIESRFFVAPTRSSAARATVTPTSPRNLWSAALNLCAYATALPATAPKANWFNLFRQTISTS